MAEWLDALRAKPVAVKNRYALLGASGATAVIAFLWIFTNFITATKTVVETDIVQDTGVFSSVFSDIKDQTAALLNSFSSENTATTTTATSSEVGTTSKNIIVPDVSKATFASSTNPSKKSPTSTGRTILIATTTSTDAQ